MKTTYRPTFSLFFKQTHSLLRFDICLFILYYATHFNCFSLTCIYYHHVLDITSSLAFFFFCCCWYVIVLISNSNSNLNTNFRLIFNVPVSTSNALWFAVLRIQNGGLRPNHAWTGVVSFNFFPLFDLLDVMHLDFFLFGYSLMI